MSVTARRSTISPEATAPGTGILDGDADRCGVLQVNSDALEQDLSAERAMVIATDTEVEAMPKQKGLHKVVVAFEENKKGLTVIQRRRKGD